MIDSVAVATGGWTERPILQVLDALASAGVRAVEIGTPPRHFDPLERDGIATVGERLRRAGIRPVSIHAPFGGFLDLADPNPRHRLAAVGAILETAHALQVLGGEVVVVHPSDRPRDGANIDESLHHCTEALERLVRGCRERDVILAVESPLPHLVGGAPAEFGRILAALPTDVAVCLDTSHLWLGGHWDRFVELAAGRRLHLHASDNHGTYDDHLPPGDGVIDWGHVGRSLAAANFSGWMVLELAGSDGPLEPYVARARTSFEALMNGGRG